MICKNCSAEYPDNQLSCPYCHTENRRVALRKKKEILKGYDKEAAAMRKNAKVYAEQTANKWTKMIFAILGIVAVIGVLVTIIFIVGSRIAVNHKYALEAEYTKELEALLEDSDYEGMQAYMREKEISGGYKKYEQVLKMYRQYKSLKESDESIRNLESFYYKNREDWDTLAEYYIDDILDSAASVINDYEQYGKDKDFLGNENALEEIYLWVAEELEMYDFEEEDLDEIALENESDRCNEFHDIVREYYWEMAE